MEEEKVVTVPHHELLKVESNRKIMEETFREWAADVSQIDPSGSDRYMVRCTLSVSKQRAVEISSQELDDMKWRHLVVSPNSTSPSALTATAKKSSTLEPTALRALLVSELKDFPANGAEKESAIDRLAQGILALPGRSASAKRHKRPRENASGGSGNTMEKEKKRKQGNVRVQRSGLDNANENGQSVAETVTRSSSRG